ncbi:hypothetical protein PGTUg99_033603 [Puccinia graminis f. sp. tritici]|uniref:Uncharacterized protein n=2 Tax=Puccinia graminis f. sp. tritici TaxID=56615 RepID=H6QQV5_PUCGT|nr:uncharacterized protein PGTG_21256 [Puccinia graminis f. sp. tritici CRL 75-36-700-3]EHS62884.1 hypothetical protein PGTG_21256 [Puccinia graminis f. sp. tritici CRL 75-36-700-3]KAA1095843.1 hypothetical protein PGTUg99_033603 [Puccinia graminis f. sp. tritici]
MKPLKAITFLSLTSLGLILAEKYECPFEEKTVGICALNEPSRHQHRIFSKGSKGKGRRRRIRKSTKDKEDENSQSEILPADQPDEKNLLIYECENKSDVQWCCPTNKFMFDDPDVSMTVDTTLLDDNCREGKEL